MKLSGVDYDLLNIQQKKQNRDMCVNILIILTGFPVFSIIKKKKKL